MLGRVLAAIAAFLTATPTLTATARVLRVGAAAPGVQATLDMALPGDVIEVPPGVWREAVTIERAVTLRGLGGVLDGGGEGTVLRIDAPGVIVEGLVVENSGTDLGGPDTCIYTTPGARGGKILGNTLSRCGFGMWIHETEGVEIVGNRVHGATEGHRSNRGNGIHLFNASKLVVKRNVVTDGRDGIYVSATEDSLIEENRMERTRYGVHYMFAHRNVIRNNVARSNSNGYALMESRGITVVGNVAEDNEEFGLLFRDAQHCTIRGNRLTGNGEGLFFYSSTQNVLERNLVAHNEIGAKIWAGSVDNTVSGNAFVGNRVQVFYVGAADLVWGTGAPGNFWSDYLGWDQDGDGYGDRPYRVGSFLANLTVRFPSAALLMRSPALELLSHLEPMLPLLRVATVVDAKPRVERDAP